ncbi:DNA polymerase III subunit chi [Alteriqipengyuania lutimaris]|uniref:DNA polymerase III subunit chi n=1 Tax=Alteriqipengyuania lutimaris TaxID=1538146 RepID=A0A395LJH8_9SPHN|nr:DNA polymerase III subunit chi [Alteriqipengyuania lutimaris]MBB3033866.1 DNA polymerase-3 subunit chi [Alteriqipengyuania lutimaris]RDS77166.1 DNA polymerase III subunit chi [Alteriqipengyuania lutimaris]
MKVDFWLLSRDPAERVVAMIAERVLADGGRALVVSGEPAQREAIGQALWDAKPEAFLANGEAGGEHDARQPILIADRSKPANGAAACILADGQWRPETLEGAVFERVFLLFDDAGRDAARAAWREVSADEGLERSFYEQRDGRWVKVA